MVSNTPIPAKNSNMDSDNLKENETFDIENDQYNDIKRNNTCQKQQQHEFR